MLGIRQCNLADLGEMVQRLSLVGSSTSIASAPAPANNLLAPSPAAPLFSIMAPNISNETNATNATQDPRRVSLVMKLDNIDYDLLAASWPLVSSLTFMSKAAIGEAG